MNSLRSTHALSSIISSSNSSTIVSPSCSSQLKNQCIGFARPTYMQLLASFPLQHTQLHTQLSRLYQHQSSSPKKSTIAFNRINSSHQHYAMATFNRIKIRSMTTSAQHRFSMLIIRAAKHSPLRSKSICTPQQLNYILHISHRGVPSCSPLLNHSNQARNLYILPDYSNLHLRGTQQLSCYI